ncbi:uncharacterized protein F5147DRAFT_776272 [Suillus discolor]|uniref:Uncharacterized protein n=1 Tax=Suillus discolor TaxID=1912936 RepID=A0A9P7F2Q8_9AGAM|nr:uncharacterized protein F5147DRAFT_776272 [Suillus discolor]KAG2102527.1 hypothetical protein F5147DRAFT_776272 [Suillus discolor]
MHFSFATVLAVIATLVASSSAIPSRVRTKSTRPWGGDMVLINHFREQLEDGPADCYLAALCLDPRYVRAVPDILTSPTYVRVLKYLKIVIEAEFKSQHNPALKGKTAADVREAFVHQFERYVKGQYPFDTMITKGLV